MRVRPGLRRWLHWIALLALAVFAGFLLYGAWYTTKESWEFRATDNSLLKTPLIIPQGLWLAGLGVFGLMVALRVVEVTLLLGRGSIAEVERLTGPRSFVEEAEETLNALGVEPERRAPLGALADRDSSPSPRSASNGGNS